MIKKIECRINIKTDKMTDVPRVRLVRASSTSIVYYFWTINKKGHKSSKRRSASRSSFKHDRKP